MTKKKRKDAVCYFKMKQDTAQKLDTRIRRSGFASRTDFFTAVAEKVLGSASQNLEESVRDWIDTQTPAQTEEQIEAVIEDTIREYLFPVLALHGADLAHERTWKDTRRIIHDRIGLWLTETELKQAYTRFEHLNRKELTDYKNENLQGDEE
ncbi:MAG: hypothetical protein IKY77_04510 [Methanocorpusculaceae archaeon]|nr:hypothetical protein [Methanocorpusculaceae archaeon]